MRAQRRWLAGTLVLAVAGGGLGSGGVLASPDDGSAVEATPAELAAVTWESLAGPPGAGRVKQLVQTKRPSHVLYATTDAGVYRSTDGGDGWDAVLELADRPVLAVAPSEAGLVSCGDGVHLLADDGLQRLLEGACESVAVRGDSIVMADGGAAADEVRVLRLDGDGEWRDVSPGPTDLAGLPSPPPGLPTGIATGPLLPVGSDILAGFRRWVEGSGEFDHGGLFRWDAGAARWSEVDLPQPDQTALTRLLADPADADRIIATFRRTIVHEQKDRVGRLAFESLDGGRTWTSLTDAEIDCNGISDVVRVGRARYLLAPWDGFMLRLKGKRWTSLPMPTIEGIPGDGVGLQTLLIDPADREIVYGMPESSWELGLVRSTDGMRSWHKMDSTIVASSPTIVLGHPDDADVLFTSGNVIQESYLTRDGGTTWRPFSPTTSGDELRADPFDPQHLLLADELSALFESRDGGRSFERIAREFAGAKVLDIAVDPDEPGRMYVSNLGVGISRMGAGEAQHLSNSPDYAYDIELDPDDGRILYAAGSPKKFERHASVWRYTPDQPQAFGWSELLRVEDATGITTLRFDPLHHDTLYAGVTGAQGGLWVSRDRGTSWAPLDPALTFTNVQGHSQLEVVPGERDTVFVGTWGGGSFRSTDSGTTWTTLDADHTFSPTCIEAWPGDPAIVYACDRTAPVIHRSLDGGATWSKYFDFGEGHLGSTAIAIDPVDPDIIYAAAFRPPAAMLGSLYRIRSGQLEADVGAGLPRAVLDIALDEQAPSTIYVSTHLHGLHVSDDAGATWRQLDDQGTGLPRTGFLDVDIDPDDPTTLYASSLCGPIPDYVMGPTVRALARGEPVPNIDPDARCGVYRSRDRGTTWELLLETLGQAKAVHVPPGSDGRLYVADDAGGVWVSGDDGASWRQQNTGLGTLSVTAVSAGDEHLYAGTQTSGVYVGTVAADGSVTWSGEDSPRVRVHRLELEIDPSDPQRLYISAYPGGVFRSDDGGRSWASKNFMVSSVRVTDPNSQGYYALDLDPADPDTVWLGIYGRGVLVSQDGRDFATFANGRDGVMRGKRITAIEVDPTDGRHVLVGAEEGVFETRDSGRTWARINRGLGTSDIESLHLSGSSTRPFRADFDDGRFDGFQLEPGWSVRRGRLAGSGHAWARAASPDWTDYTVKAKVRLDRGALHLNTSVSTEGRYLVGLDEDTLYLAKTFDRWQRMRELATVRLPIGRKAHVVRIDRDGGRIRVFLDGKLRLKHRDRRPLPAGSIAFESLAGSKATIDDVRARPKQAALRVFAGTAGYGVYELVSSDRRWRHLGRSLGTGWWSPWERRMYQFSSLRFDPREEGLVYLGHFPGGFFVSRDGGRSWRDSSISLGNDGIFSLAQHPSDPATLFAGTYNGILRSTDGGATWADSSSGLPAEQWPFTIAIDPDDPDVMYTTTKNGQNKGFCHRNDFCGVVMRSDDGGRSWERIMSGLHPESEFYTLIIDPRDRALLYLSTSRGVFASLDAGDRWWPMDSGLPTEHNEVRDNVADNLVLGPDGRHLVLGLVKHGAWRADIGALAGDS